jgi:hypothetical protein
MPRRRTDSEPIHEDQQLTAIAEEEEVQTKLQRIEDQLQNLMNQQTTRSSGIIYGSFGWDFRFSSSKLI